MCEGHWKIRGIVFQAEFGKASPKNLRQELQGQPGEGQILEQDKQHTQEQGVYSKCEGKALKVQVEIHI